MNKLVLLLTLVLGIQGYSQKSEATVSMIALGYAVDDGTAVGMNLALMGGMLGVGGLIVGGVTAIFNPAAGLKVALIGISLDAEGGFPRKNVEQFFVSRYGFINNQETIKELSEKIENEFAQGFMEIHLSEEQLNKILESEDLSSEQYQLITQDLM